MKICLGIELGSTRIKTVLINELGKVLSVGIYSWQDYLEEGYWSYKLEDAIKGVQQSYSNLIQNYGKKIDHIDAIGISAMMHGYLAFDKDDKLLTPFRTWRNVTTNQASEKLSREFSFNIPQRWTVAHYYQAVLNEEKHVKDVAFLTTLSGYVCYKLTGSKCLGVGDASGMFPVDENCQYDERKLKKFNDLLRASGIDADFKSILPKIKNAGESAGVLTEYGAKLLDVTGTLKGGAVVCPPEGDAGTGMVATNSVKPNTANVSAGTSAFLMAVLEKGKTVLNPNIDMVVTPDGYPVAMIHANNCTSELNAWVELFGQVLNTFDFNVSKNELFTRLFQESIKSDSEVGKLVGLNFISGEPIANAQNSKLMVERQPDGNFSIANFMQMQIFSAVAPLSIGMDILQEEGIDLDEVVGHGGLFKTPQIGQKAMSLALKSNVSVANTASEGGAYGMALLALFSIDKERSLGSFLEGVFKDVEKTFVSVTDDDRMKFSSFMQRYKQIISTQ